MNNDTEHYKKTMREALDIDDDGRKEKRREDILDAEIAFETLAVNSSMGMLGMEETTANLLQLELARELLKKEAEELNGPTDADRD